MNKEVAKLVVIRGPQGIATVTGGKLLNLVNRHHCDFSSAEFKAAWDSICQDKYGQACELIGITYAEASGR